VLNTCFFLGRICAYPLYKKLLNKVGRKKLLILSLLASFTIGILNNYLLIRSQFQLVCVLQFGLGLFCPLDLLIRVSYILMIRVNRCAVWTLKWTGYQKCNFTVRMWEALSVTSWLASSQSLTMMILTVSCLLLSLLSLLFLSSLQSLCAYSIRTRHYHNNLSLTINSLTLIVSNSPTSNASFHVISLLKTLWNDNQR
jgi:hypothetical protein